MRAVAIGVLMFASGIGQVAQAAAVFGYDSGVPATTRGDGPWVVGNLFSVGGVAHWVTALGVQDVGLSGFVANSLLVGIWDSTGTTLLASASVLTTDTLLGSYRYHSLAAPILLTANTQYLIGAQVGAGLEFFLDDPSAPVPFSATAGFTLLQNRFRSGSTFLAPLNDGTLAVGRWAPANADATPVPEPSGLILTACGLVALVTARWLCAGRSS
jgi:hypothetical protein